MSENNSQFGIVELMGHKVVAGAISKDEMLGKPMLRVDVPATSAFPAFSQFYGEAAIYCVTFTSEEVANRVAEQNKTNPISVYTPSLVTQEQLEEVKDAYNARLDALRRQLPAGDPRIDADEGPDDGDEDGDDEDREARQKMVDF
jgi:arylsulfatase A-like enzyme